MKNTFETLALAHGRIGTENCKNLQEFKAVTDLEIGQIFLFHADERCKIFENLPYVSRPTVEFLP